jgi:hypothetical protein
MRITSVVVVKEQLHDENHLVADHFGRLKYQLADHRDQLGDDYA